VSQNTKTRTFQNLHATNEGDSLDVLHYRRIRKVGVQETRADVARGLRAEGRVIMFTKESTAKVLKERHEVGENCAVRKSNHSFHNSKEDDEEDRTRLRGGCATCQQSRNCGKEALSQHHYRLDGRRRNVS
jgi:hypothetical protein